MAIVLEEATSGVTREHAVQIARVCQALDIFLFIRPSEAETMQLIKAGFATKSMDVHDKSSNWGPMAGAVPLDRAFSKKFLEHEQPQSLERPEDMWKKIKQNCGQGCRANHTGCKVAAHGVERPIQLMISERVRALWQGAEKMELADPSQALADQRTYRGLVARAGRVSNNLLFTLDRVAVPLEVLTAWGLPNEPDLRTFWKVSWGWRTDDRSPYSAPQPLFVWGYPVPNARPEWARDLSTARNARGDEYSWPWKSYRAVTGDYDLWMVAPHMCWWKLHMHVVKFVDEHHVPSAATFFNNWLLAKLNEACERTDNPVFNHGAEEQNYGFTQNLDPNLVMFTSSGNARMVDMANMSRVMAELAYAGYLVFWNKRYDEVRPPMNGASYASLVTAYQTARETLGRLTAERDGAVRGLDLSQTARGSVADLARVWDLNDLIGKARGEVQAKQADLRAREVEYERISALARTMTAEMEAMKGARAANQHPGFRVLRPDDVQERDKIVGQATHVSPPDDVLVLQGQLQRLIVNATALGGDGESDIESLEDRYDASSGALELLSTKVRQAPNGPRTDGEMLRPSTEAQATFAMHSRGVAAH
jgi:hypothetical protein